MARLKHSEQLPRPAAELERLAEYYDTHETSTEMDNGDRIERALSVGHPHDDQKTA